MYLPRIGPANKYDPMARMQQPQSRGLLGVAPSFQPANIDQGLLTQGMQAASSMAQGRGQDLDIKEIMQMVRGQMDAQAKKEALGSTMPGDISPATKGSIGAFEGAVAGRPLPGGQLGAFDQAVDTGLTAQRFAPSPEQAVLASSNGPMSNLGLQLRTAIRGGLDNLGITGAVQDLRGQADNMRPTDFANAGRFGQNRMMNGTSPIVQQTLRQMGIIR